MKPVEIGLIDTTGSVDTHLMAATVAALNVQVKHLRQYWTNAPEATAILLTAAKAAPPGVWQIQLVASLQEKEGGFHSINAGEPFAKVVVTPGSNDWTIDASHEALEMLVDPGGNKVHVARAIKLVGTDITDGEGNLEYLLEVSDPCEGPRYTYKIGDIEVSDFITPDYYSAAPAAGKRYSYTGAITAPRQILHGGYITWIDPKTKVIEQLLWLATDTQPRTRQVGTSPNASLREYVDSQTRHVVHQARAEYHKNHNGGGRTMPMKFQIGAGEKTKRSKYEKPHTVTYHQDGEIEREVWDPGAHESKIVPEKVKAGVPIKRPAGTEHIVKNLGGHILTGEKEM
jgi:hypothetical protein